MCCGQEMFIAGTAGKDLGHIIECGRCGRRAYDRPDLVEAFLARIIAENMAGQP